MVMAMLCNDGKAKANTSNTSRSESPKRYRPTPRQRRLVLGLSSHGVGDKEINDIVDPACSRQMFTSAYKDQLACGRARFKCLIIQTLMMHLVGRPAEYDGRGRLLRRAVRPSARVAIFLAKSILGWGSKRAGDAESLYNHVNPNDPELARHQGFSASSVSKGQTLN
jgi:hypothetical protein